MSRFLKLALVLGMLFLTDTMTITAQNLAVKTNVLYWTTATFNASVETRLSSKWTLDVSAGYNPFTFSDNKKWFFPKFGRLQIVLSLINVDFA